MTQGLDVSGGKNGFYFGSIFEGTCAADKRIGIRLIWCEKAYFTRFYLEMVFR